MGSTSFSVLATPGTPLVIAAGEHIRFIIKYHSLVAGTPEIATIRIVSNDPDAPTVDLSATGSQGTATMATVIADSGNFGRVRVGSFVDQELTINNSGSCPLQVFNLGSSSAEFLLPAVVSYSPRGGCGRLACTTDPLPADDPGREGRDHLVDE